MIFLRKFSFCCPSVFNYRMYRVPVDVINLLIIFAINISKTFQIMYCLIAFCGGNYILNNLFKNGCFKANFVILFIKNKPN